MIIPRWMHSLSRVDFLNSVGLYITRNSLSLVCLRKDLFRISLVAEEVREISAVGNEAAGRQALADTIAPLLTNFNPAEDPFYICLSPDQTLVCEVLLPQVAEESMRQVLEYEIERLPPLSLCRASQGPRWDTRCTVEFWYPTSWGGYHIRCPVQLSDVLFQ
jgi:hypothetical protein